MPIPFAYNTEIEHFTTPTPTSGQNHQNTPTPTSRRATEGPRRTTPAPRRTTPAPRRTTPPSDENPAWKQWFIDNKTIIIIVCVVLILLLLLIRTGVLGSLFSGSGKIDDVTAAYGV